MADEPWLALVRYRSSGVEGVRARSEERTGVEPGGPRQVLFCGEAIVGSFSSRFVGPCWLHFPALVRASRAHLEISGERCSSHTHTHRFALPRRLADRNDAPHAPRVPRRRPVSVADVPGACPDVPALLRRRREPLWTSRARIARGKPLPLHYTKTAGNRLLTRCIHPEPDGRCSLVRGSSRGRCVAPSQ